MSFPGCNFGLNSANLSSILYFMNFALFSEFCNVHLHRLNGIVGMIFVSSTHKNTWWINMVWNYWAQRTTLRNSFIPRLEVYLLASNDYLSGSKTLRSILLEKYLDFGTKSEADASWYYCLKIRKYIKARTEEALCSKSR